MDLAIKKFHWTGGRDSSRNNLPLAAFICAYMSGSVVIRKAIKNIIGRIVFLHMVSDFIL
jgi:hypothetical protein